MPCVRCASTVKGRAACGQADYKTQGISGVELVEAEEDCLRDKDGDSQPLCGRAASAVLDIRLRPFRSFRWLGDAQYGMGGRLPTAMMGEGIIVAMAQRVAPPPRSVTNTYRHTPSFSASQKLPTLLAGLTMGT